MNFATSVVRTGVPYVWGVLVAWLAARGLPDEVLASVNDPKWSAAVVSAGVVAITTAVYALARVIELHLPRVLRAVGLPDEVVTAASNVVLVLLLGVPRPPDYTGPAQR